MTRLRIDWTSRALREAKRLDPPNRQRIATALDAFVEMERGDVVLLTDVTPPEYRLRVGPWRVRFHLDRKAGALVVLRVLPRGKAYR